MSYRPDYERALSQGVQDLIPKTLEGWSLVALTILGIVIVILVLEAVKESFAHPQDETPPQPRVRAEP